jgi:hypothetical protein
MGAGVELDKNVTKCVTVKGRMGGGGSCRNVAHRNSGFATGFASKSRSSTVLIGSRGSPLETLSASVHHVRTASGPSFVIARIPCADYADRDQPQIAQDYADRVIGIGRPADGEAVAARREGPRTRPVLAPRDSERRALVSVAAHLSRAGALRVV